MGSVPSLPLFTSGPLRSATLNRVRDVVATILNPPRCNAYLTANTTIPNGSVTTVGLGAELYDVVQTGDTPMHDNTTNNSRVTIRTAGYYRVVGQVTFAANATGTRAVQVRKNGAVLTENYQAASTGSSSCQATIDVLLSVGDYLELQAYQTSGAGLNALGGSSLTFLQVTFAGASSTTSGEEATNIDSLHAESALGTSDLDAVKAPGNYVQGTAADATLARHYPAATVTGHLQVTSDGLASPALVSQRWVSSSTNDVYVRTYSGAAWAAWETVGGSSAPDFVSLARSTNQSYSSGSVTAVSWDTETEDASGFHDNAVNPSRITVPAGKAGLYLLTWQLAITGTSPGTTSMSIKKNGTTTLVDTTGAMSGQTGGLTLSTTIRLSAGDYVEMNVWTSSGSSLAMVGLSGGNYRTQVQATRLGA